MNFRLLLLSLLLILSCTVTGAPSANIVGAWVCGPYEISDQDFAITAVDRPVYSNDGTFAELGKATYTLPGGTKIRTETKHAGHWSLQADLIEIRFTSAEFLSSDHPAVTVAAGQASLDAMMQRKNWTRKRILKLDGQELVTIPVDTNLKQAEVKVSCSKA